MINFRLKIYIYASSLKGTAVGEALSTWETRIESKFKKAIGLKVLDLKLNVSKGNKSTYDEDDKIYRIGVIRSGDFGFYGQGSYGKIKISLGYISVNLKTSCEEVLKVHSFLNEIYPTKSFSFR